MKEKKRHWSYPIFRAIRPIVKFFYPRITAEGQENLTDEPTIIVGNHAQMNGPLCAEFYMPRQSVTWCAGEMMHLKKVPSYAYRDFWCNKPKPTRFFYKLLSYIIAPLSVLIFNNASTIAVYHDERIITTFRQTITALKDGKSVVIFPEHAKEYNNILCEFQSRFIDIARLYHKSTGKELTFTPLYVAPRLKKVFFGKPVTFDSNASIYEERERVCRYLMDEITAMARSLPAHIVVPYENVSRKEYKTNK